MGDNVTANFTPGYNNSISSPYGGSQLNNAYRGESSFITTPNPNSSFRASPQIYNPQSDYYKTPGPYSPMRYEDGKGGDYGAGIASPG